MAGPAVFALRDEGYEAYGVDVTTEAIESGRQLARARGLDAKKVLKVLDAEGGTSYPDGFFDFTCSLQGFEHIEDIDRVACELTRVMKEGGKGIHFFPAQHFVLEPHVKMPLFHWLPKNRLRWPLIRLFAAIGIHADVPAHRELSGAELTERIYRFSCDRTFYRPIAKICAGFEQAGTRATPDTVYSPTVRSNGLVGPLARQEWLAPLLNWVMVRFHTVHLRLERGTTSRSTARIPGRSSGPRAPTRSSNRSLHLQPNLRLGTLAALREDVEFRERRLVRALGVVGVRVVDPSRQ